MTSLPSVGRGGSGTTGRSATSGTEDEPQIDLDRFPAARLRRVRIVTPTFSPEPIGTPLYATELARWLAADGWKVDVVTGQPHYPRFRRYDGYGRGRRRDMVQGIPVYRLPTLVPRQGTSPWRAICDTNFLLQGLLARRRLGRSPLTIAISPGVPFAVPVARWLTAADGTLLVWVHDVQSGLAAALGAGSALTRGSAVVERRCLNLGDHVYALSEGMARRLRGLGVHRPMTTFTLWPTLPADDGHRPLPTVDVLYSGNIGQKQGCGQLLDLAEGLAERRPGTTLLIRGDRHARAELEREAAARCLLGVTFDDLAPREDLRRALRTGRVYVIPQAPDVGDNVLPSKAVNALAAGCQVVAAGAQGSAVADLGERSPNVTVTRPGDVAGMIEAVLALLDR